MKKIKTDTILKNLKGENMQEQGEDLTLGMVLATVLSGPVDNPYKGFLLAKKFATEKEVEVQSEDIVYVKKELEKKTAYGSIVIGQTIEMLES